MNAHRTGGSLVFRNDAGEFIGVVPMSTLPLLVACGEPMLIGLSVALTEQEKKPESDLGRVTRPSPENIPVQVKKGISEVDGVTPFSPKSAPELVNTPGSARKYEVIPQKKMTPRPAPSPSSFVRQSYRKVPAGGV